MKSMILATLLFSKITFAAELVLEHGLYTSPGQCEMSISSGVTDLHLGTDTSCSLGAYSETFSRVSNRNFEQRIQPPGLVTKRLISECSELNSDGRPLCIPEFYDYHGNVVIKEGDEIFKRNTIGIRDDLKSFIRFTEVTVLRGGVLVVHSLRNHKEWTKR